MVELNGDGQGSDTGLNLLVTFLGKLSQMSVFCPISVERWDRMPEEKKRLQWHLIEEKFEFDYAVGIKWVMHSLGERWRAHKYKLRCENFYPNKSKKVILANPPANVDSTDWTAFVHHYHEKKMKEQKLGRPVCRNEVVLSMLLKKDGNYVNEGGKILADKISEHLLEDQERAATLGVPLKILDAIEKFVELNTLIGVRGLGASFCPWAAFGMSRQSISVVNFGSSKKLEESPQNENYLATLHSFGSELLTFNLDSC
ncbi:unnamed protein product [Withania somnifera]